MDIRSGQSGEYGVMLSDGRHTVSCRKMNDKIEYLLTENERLRPWLQRLPVLRVMEKMRLMFHNTHPHVQFLKGLDEPKAEMPFYLRFILFMLITGPIYFVMMWLVWTFAKNLPFYWLELLIEAVCMYGLFMIIAIGSMTAVSKRYHSAEHQIVNAIRTHGSAATVADAQRASRYHAQCGTGAAFSVAVGVFLTLLVFYAFVPFPEFWLYGPLNYVLFPLGVSVGLELFVLVPFLYRKTGLVWLVYPSYLLQRFTTKKATPEELEVAWLAAQKLHEVQQDRAVR